jgi:two-component system, cell cycle response regulator
LALTDPLTGLGNRRHFHERLETDLDRAEREGGRLALCVIDVDDFKRVKSAGVAVFPATERNELQRTADQALYRAKDGGKNAVAA